MKRNKGIRSLSCVCIAALLLSGCGQAEAENRKAAYSALLSMESTPVIDYTVPQQLPNILVSEAGYQTGRENEAAVKGRELPETFSLIDAVTGEEVYTGRLEDIRYDKELEIYTGSIPFGQFSGQGSYYLECSIVGRSATFPIGEALYRERFENLLQDFFQEDREHSLPELAELLTVCEWYPQLLPDEDTNKIPDILEQAGKWLKDREKSDGTTQEDALHAALLAKFSYIYQKYDHTYAIECLKRASAIYAKLQTSLKKDADNFFALTELYRATGRYQYRSQIQEYRSYFENSSGYLKEPGYLYGSMTYLSTRQKVDRELCTALMENIMSRGEEISRHYEERIHPVTARNNGAEELLKEATDLACANYVMNNYQYTNIIEKFLQYLTGQNVGSVCFYEEDSFKAGYLLLSAQLAAVEEDR